MIIAEIVSQHAEEAAFLWLLRSNAICQPHYALKDLAKLDGRVEAHLDGLRVAACTMFAEAKDSRAGLHGQSRGGPSCMGVTRGVGGHSHSKERFEAGVYGVA
jgi:hypothetical protein